MSPTQRTLAHLRKQGYTCAIVEKYIAAIRQRKDVFGFGDVLAVKVGEPGSMLVQATTNTGGQFSKHLMKIKTIAEAGIWLAAGNRIRLVTWAKQGAHGKRKVWTCRELDITPEVLQT